MGDYGADVNPDISKFKIIRDGYSLFTREKTKIDQWTLGDGNAVYKFVEKRGSNCLRFLVDPSLIES